MERSGGIVYAAAYRIAPIEHAVYVKPEVRTLSGNGDMVPLVRREYGGGFLSVGSSKIPRGGAGRIQPERQFGIGALFVELKRHPLEVVFREHSLVHGGNVIETYPGFDRPIGRSEVLPRMVGKVEKVPRTVEAETASSENALCRRNLRVPDGFDGSFSSTVDDGSVGEIQKERGIALDSNRRARYGERGGICRVLTDSEIAQVPLECEGRSAGVRTYAVRPREVARGIGRRISFFAVDVYLQRSRRPDDGYVVPRVEIDGIRRGSLDALHRLSVEQRSVAVYAVREPSRRYVRKDAAVR